MPVICKHSLQIGESSGRRAVVLWISISGPYADLRKRGCELKEFYKMGANPELEV